MIDIKSTILETIKDKIYKMRFLGQNDPDVIKNILYLIVIDDIYDWTLDLYKVSPTFKDEMLAVQKKLLELRALFVLNHGEFIVKTGGPDNLYVNVNTPQTLYTWRRVWDDPDLVDITTEIAPLSITPSAGTPFIPDPTCPLSLVYFGGLTDDIPSNTDGTPIVDFDTLTVCDKMNIYINRNDTSPYFGKMFFLNPDTCTWQQVKGGSDSLSGIDDSVTIYQGIRHSLGKDSETGDDILITELLTSNSPRAELSVAGEDEINDVL